MDEKRCNTCNQEKSTSDYHKNKSNKDGLDRCCKDCRKIANANYHSTDKGKEAARRAWMSEKGKATSRRSFEKIRGTNIKAARNAVAVAVRKGTLPNIKKQICSSCGGQAKQYHHHHGYEPSAWLDVVPLCVYCHVREEGKG